MPEYHPIGPQIYTHWRTTTLGRITEKLEIQCVLDLAGEMQGKRVLDAGTGDGAYALEAAARGAFVTGLDPDREMLDAATRRAEGSHLRIDFRPGRVEALPFADASFEVVIAVAVFGFVSDTGSAIRETARVLVPGGRLVLGDLGRFNVWAAERRIRGWLGSETWRHAHFRSRRDLARLAEYGGLRNFRFRSCIYFPPFAIAARILAPFDTLFSRMHAPGAAFIVLSAEKPLEQA